MSYYITVNGTPVGPMNMDQMLAYNITPDTPVSRDGGVWAPLYTYPELMEMYRRSGYAYAKDAEISSKKTICGICAILVGSLGVQYFVLGKVAGGFITILLSIVTCGLWSIVTLIQGIMMLCMSDSDFKTKYMDSNSTLPLF